MRSERKMVKTSLISKAFFFSHHQTKGYLLTMVGEPEAVLQRCGTALVEGQERPVDENYKSAFR